MTTMTAPFTVICSAANRAEWLKARLTGVGASESPVLMNVSTYQSAVELWGIKTGRITPTEGEESDRQLWGQRLEPLVAEEYERKTQRPLIQWGLLLRSTRWPWMICTPDYALRDGEDIPVEIKTADISRRSEWAEGPPPRVNIQCQHQMAVTGAKRASVGLLVGGNTFYWADINRDDALIAQIVWACESFWGRVLDGMLPPIDASEKTAAALGKIFPQAVEGESLTLPSDALMWTAAYQAAKLAKDLAETDMKAAENSIRAAIGNAETGSLPDGSGFWTNKNVRRKEYVAKASEYRQLRLSRKDSE